MVLRTLLIASLCAACGDDDAACVTDDECPAFQRCLAMRCAPIGTPRDGGPRIDGGAAARDAGPARDGDVAPDAGLDAGTRCAAPADCDDGNPCTTEACLPSGCVWSPVPGGTSCEDGVFCNGQEACVDGVCRVAVVTCPDGATCDEAARACRCDDGDPCTTLDTLGPEGCIGVPVMDDTPCEPCLSEACRCCATGCVPITTEANCGACGRRCPFGRVCEYADGMAFCSIL